MATEAQQMTAEAGDLPQIDFGQQLKELTAAVPQEKDPKRRAILQQDLNHVQGVNDLLAMKPAGGGAPASTASAPAPGHKSAVDELLAMPKLADTSNPEGNKDPRDYKNDQRIADEARYDATVSPGGGWFRTAAKALMPTDAGKSGVDSILNTLTPRGMAAAGRGVLTHLAGAPGDFENAMVQTDQSFRPGEDPALAGHRTALPTSEEISTGLGKVGLPADPYRQGTEQGAGAMASLAAPGVMSQASRVPGAARVQRLGNEAAADVSGAARAGQQRIVGQNPMPGPVADPALPPTVQPQYPQPRPPQPQMPDIPPSYPTPQAPAKVTAPVVAPRTAPNTASSQLEGHILENDARLGAEKSAAYEAYKAATPPKGIDLQDFKNDLTVRIARAGTDEEATALRKVLNRVNTIEAESDTQFESLDKLRRQLGKNAKFGETPSGYEAIGTKQAGDLNRALGDRMKTEHPAYAEYTKKYHDLSQESQPSGSAFLKGVGEKEGSADLVKNALASPKNVDQTIAAIGADGASKLDALAVKHVQNTLGKAKGDSLEKAYTDMLPSLERLPGAKAKATEIFNTSQMRAAEEGAVQTALKAQQRAEKAAEEAAGAANEGRKAQREARFTGAMGEQKAATQAAEESAAAANKSATGKHAAQAEGVARDFSAKVRANEAAQKTASSFTPMLNNLQQDISPARRIDVLRQMNDSMLKKGIIGAEEHAGFGAQIEKAANAAEKQQALQTLSKYVAYTLTGNYMISFGGPHLVSYLQK